MDTINDRIALLRKHLNLTRKAFGEPLGVSDSVIKNIEYNIVSPKPLLLNQICKEYNVDPDWLRTGEGEMFLAKDDITAMMDFAEDMFGSEDLVWLRRLCEYINALSPEERAEVSRYVRELAQAVLDPPESEPESEKEQEI